MKTVTVTGGYGFIGSNLVKKLVEAGYNVNIADNLSRGRRDFVGDVEHTFHECDIGDLTALSEAFIGSDYVIHLAAYGSVIESIANPQENFEINGQGTLNALTAARDAGAGKFIFASTGGALIGNAIPPVNEASAPRPQSPYGASKLVGEGYCSAFSGSYDLATVVLRFGNVYGPVSAHKMGAVTKFCKAFLNDSPITVYGDGSASRDYLHVYDLCDGIIRALDTDLGTSAVMHLAAGVETTINDLIATLKDVSGKVDHPVEYLAKRKGEVERNFADIARARELIGFAPAISLQEGLKATYEWFGSLDEDSLA